MNHSPNVAINAVNVHAEVITRPGGLGDTSYPALAIELPGFDSPYVLTLALPAVVYQALSEQISPLSFYGAIANAVNAMSDIAAADAFETGEKLDEGANAPAQTRTSRDQMGSPRRPLWGISRRGTTPPAGGLST